MITMKELVGSSTDIPSAHQSNLADLLIKINKIRSAWAKPMTVTSGYRTKADHLRIYKALAAKRGVKFDETKIPWGSKHLSCEAVDISDPDGTLHAWCVANTALLEEIGLWCEVKDDQARVHFQTVAPKSGKRFFNP